MLAMDLPSYIREVGAREAAKQFKVKPRTAASWRNGERFPRREKAVEIERLTRGKVTVAEIFGGP